ncbi:hypothetical protein CMI47_13625 [Candidatus Pacearchaeota archaeon]|nr:hypothetical protein [Candidatus Pacearchaeota archaeon]|tara:strand:+ start:254 stop:571 length:318 start_codon:yes stop_codon:yes gene_type:complete
MGLKYYGTDAEIKTFTNKTFADQIKLLQDRENDITATAREVVFSADTFSHDFGEVDTITLDGQILHQLKLTQSTSKYELTNEVIRNYSIVIDCGAAISGDATLPL